LQYAGEEGGRVGKVRSTVVCKGTEKSYLSHNLFQKRVNGGGLQIKKGEWKGKGGGSRCSLSIKRTRLFRRACQSSYEEAQKKGNGREKEGGEGMRKEKKDGLLVKPLG